MTCTAHDIHVTVTCEVQMHSSNRARAADACSSVSCSPDVSGFAIVHLLEQDLWRHVLWTAAAAATISYWLMLIGMHPGWYT
jgi:hypothetical protein